jgi:hypothetical protein
MNEPEYDTTIQLSNSTRDRIKKCWQNLDDTYDKVLNRILDAYEKTKK